MCVCVCHHVAESVRVTYMLALPASSPLGQILRPAVQARTLSTGLLNLSRMPPHELLGSQSIRASVSPSGPLAAYGHLGTLGGRGGEGRLLLGVWGFAHFHFLEGVHHFWASGGLRTSTY